MKKLLSDRENLQALIHAEWINYNKAIKDNKPFAEIKIIYLRIKELKQQIREVTTDIRSQLNMGD